MTPVNLLKDLFDDRDDSKVIGCNPGEIGRPENEKLFLSVEDPSPRLLWGAAEYAGSG